MTMKLSRAWALALLCAAVAGQALAQGYPSKPVRLIVPQAAGSTADLVARVLGEEMARNLGQPVVVDNKTGAGGSLATAELANAPRDGHTIGLVSQGTLVFNPSLYAKLGYDPVKDFTPVALIGGVSNVLIVPATSQARSVADVIAAAKASPGKLTYASGGAGTSHHLSGVLFAQRAGLNLVHVPYKGAPQGVVAVMSGEVDMALFNTPTVLAQIRAGTVRALAVTGLTRSPLLPDVPTMDEAGVRGYEVITWLGLATPAGVAPDVISRLSASVTQVMQNPAVRAKLGDQGLELSTRVEPQALSQTLKDDLAKWPAIIKAAGAKVE